MILPYASGIYAIRHLVSGTAYIGRTLDLHAARQQHWYKLKTGRHHNRLMQDIYNEEGPRALTFEKLEECDPADLLTRADYYMLQEEALFNTNGPLDAARANRAKSPPPVLKYVPAPLPAPPPVWTPPKPVILNGRRLLFPTDEHRAQAEAQQE